MRLKNIPFLIVRQIIDCYFSYLLHDDFSVHWRGQVGVDKALVLLWQHGDILYFDILLLSVWLHYLKFNSCLLLGWSIVSYFVCLLSLLLSENFLLCLYIPFFYWTNKVLSRSRWRSDSGRFKWVTFMSWLPSQPVFINSG